MAPANRADRCAFDRPLNSRRLLLPAIGWLALAPLWCGAGVSPTAALRPPLPADIDLERPSRSDGAIIVKLRLDGGEGVPLLVDTGSTDTTLDESFAPKLGPRLATRGAPFAFDLRAGTQGIYRAPKLYAGGTELLMGTQVATMKRLPSARMAKRTKPGISKMLRGASTPCACFR